MVKAVRKSKVIKILKSYLLIRSEREYYADGYREIRTSTREDFSGIEMNPHHGDLLNQQDHVLVQLDKGSKRFQRYKPNLDQVDLQGRKFQYGTLRKPLLEVDREALEVLNPCVFQIDHPLRTPVDAHRITFDILVCAPYSVFITDRL